jgi:hypothetical protein
MSSQKEEALGHKRELRLRIARSRRRIDRRLRTVNDEARRLFSWKTYVIRFPVQALAAALGVGFVASAGLNRGRVARWLGALLLRQAGQGFLRGLWVALLDVWKKSGDSSGRKAS